MGSMHEAERGLFELQRGRPLLLTSFNTPTILVTAVEGLLQRALDQMDQLHGGGLRLAVTSHRAKAIGVSRGANDVSIGLAPGADPARIMHLSCVRGEFAGQCADVREASAAESAALMLAKLGRLLPALVGVAADPGTNPVLRQMLESGAVLTVSSAQIDDMAANNALDLVHVSKGPVPLEHAEQTQVMVFREGSGLLEHVAIVVGSPETWPDAVPVRLHSACFTGDLFGSLRCDCGEQLRGSLRAFSARGGGVLVYLAHEGRGIGLANKLRAYELQEEGLDTEEADAVLGFGADERQYDTAVAILRHLGIRRVQLLTNNPEKMRAVQEGGIEVLDRQPLYGRLNRHNVRYVTTKVRAGHWLDDMLAGASSNHNQ
jgi:GTP cyclohydrolase II